MAKKPDPEAINYLMRKTGIPRNQTLLVGNSIVDVETAKNAKIRMALVTYGFGKPATLRNVKVNYKLKRFSELLKCVI